MSSWITTKLLGIRQVLSGSTILPQRGTINFIAGATVADNPATGATDVSITADNIFTNATHLALPDTIVERAPDGSANFGGTCDFEVINVAKDAAVSGALSCAILTASESMTCGGILTCAVMNTGDLGASGNIFATGSLDCGALSCTQVYSAGNAVVGGSLTVVGGASVSGNIVNAGNILTTGTISCSGVATIGSLSCVGAASVGSLTSGADVTCAPGSSFKLGSTRTYTRVAGVTPLLNPATWNLGIGIGVSSVGTGAVLYIPLSQLPPGATLTSISVWVQSNNSHSLPLPTAKRSVSLVYVTSSSGVNTTTWTTSDPSTTAAAYDGYHAIVATGAPMTFNQSIVAAYIKFTDESGANSVAGNTLFSVGDFSYTMDRVVGT